MLTKYSYDKYFDQKDRMDMIQDFKNEYPNLFDYEIILKTLEGKDVVAVTITNKDTGLAKDKAAFYIDANTHAGEITGMMSAMYTMDALVSNFARDEKVTYLLNNYAFYIIPCVSPDGSDTYLHTPYMLRSVNREYKKEDKGLHQEDIDNDGIIRMIRIKTPYGNFKKDAENPELMVPREADDLYGDFYNVFTEGFIKDYDGANVKIARETWGLDFNRNYPYGWFNDFRQEGAGEYPLSNAENKAIVDFVIAHPNICSVLTHHTSGGILLTPPGTYSSKKAPSFDVDVYKNLGRLCKKTLGYPDINIFDGFMTDQENYDSGAFDDWCYETKGVYATTLELWDIEQKAGKPNLWGQKENIYDECERFKACYKWVLENCPEHYQAWTKYNHPELGEVEIGGFNPKYTFQNPPVKFLKDVVEKCFDFTLSYASLLPRLEVTDIKKDKISDNLYQVEFIVGNLGYLPTFISEKAKMIQANRGIDITINGKCINQEPKFNIGELDGYSNTISTAMYYGNIATFGELKNRKKVSFIVEGEDVEITISGNKVNTIKFNI